MIKNQRKTLCRDALCDKKKELEEIRRILNENSEAAGFDYQQLLAISQRMDEVILEYIKIENMLLEQGHS